MKKVLLVILVNLVILATLVSLVISLDTIEVILSDPNYWHTIVAGPSENIKSLPLTGHRQWTLSRKEILANKLFSVLKQPFIDGQRI